MPRLSCASLAVVYLLAASLVALSSAARDAGIVERINAQVKEKGYAVGAYKVHDEVIRRELLLSTCTFTSINITVRYIQNWDLDGTKMYEIGFRNLCDKPIVGNTRFSDCTNFYNTLPRYGCQNPTPAANRTQCETVPTFQQVNLVINGQNYGGWFCQLFINDGSCSMPTQIPAGGKVSVYYFSKLAPVKPCSYSLQFRHSNGTITTSSNRNVFVSPKVQPMRCAVDLPDYGPPPGYECQVGDNVPGLIYCPPWSGQ